ncbi:MAG: DUF1572 family protein [Planctomycetes bacterium]|nr:DUF1572 family protein [Planctomycetota bacterium]
MDERALLTDFAASAARKIDQDRKQIVRCLSLLGEAAAWTRPNEQCNSAANQVLHLTGNVRQWILGGLGNENIMRDRAAEFAARPPRPLAPILAEFERTIDAAIQVVHSITPEALAREYSIQGYRLSGLLAVFHVAEHFSFHTGQIVHITKTITCADVSLYDAKGQLAGQAGGKPW